MAGRSKALTALCTATLCALILSKGSRQQAQQEQVTGSRQIVAEEFTGKRPAASQSATPQTRRGKSPTRPGQSASNTASMNTQTARKRIYRPTSAQPVTASANLSGGAGEIAQLGVTLWRLRPANATDQGARLLEHEEQSDVLEWTPERVAAETMLRIGDRLRLSIESPRTGYLYVIDREQYADGTMGSPSLIFPTLRTRGGDNRVRAGLLVEIPAQEDLPPYFTLTRSRADQTGEIITIIVTPRPIEDISIKRNQHQLAAEQLAQWERMWGVPAERFEMDGGAGTAWTGEEKSAGATMGRALTQEEPGPQTIYRVTLKSGAPLLVTVPLRYGAR